MEGSVETTLTKCYGFSASKLKETIKNQELTNKLLALATEAGITESGCDKAVGNLLLEVAAKYPEEAIVHRPTICRKIASGDLKSRVQVSEAFKFLKGVGANDLNEEAFNSAAGIGVVITPKDIEDAVDALIKENEAEVNEKGPALAIPFLKKLQEKTLKWANPKDIKTTIDEKLKGKGSGKPVAKAKPVAPVKPKQEEKKDEEQVHLMESVKFHKPEENIRNPPEILKKHLEATGGRVVTRFPPEPNGYLHIGHCKAMNINFGYAKKNGGWCYMRFDDTNPEKESQEYIKGILDNVHWLGHTPYKVTHASDYFQILYDFAVSLIKKDKAFVCHQTAEEIKASRKSAKTKGGKPEASPWRNRPIEESLKIFEDMRKGKCKEGEATLRMKQDLDNPNPCMWDHVAYRIRYAPHPHAGDKWCIYPTYDYTHCICDSIENITHSLCSLEFEVRRESYDWLLDALDVYRSPQIEYSRLNITHVVLSKRKLITLVTGGYVNGWDDPRMPTIVGLRRRGYTPEALNDFCERIGLTRSANLQDYSLLEECLRQHLDGVTDRKMAVISPLKVEITNYPDDLVEEFDAPNHPVLDKGSRKVKFSKVIYIDQNDFRLTDSKNFYRLAPGKEVRLKYAYVIKCTDVVTDKNGKVLEVKATYDKDSKAKLKGNIQWVARPKASVEPLAVEVREYGKLFKSKLPEGTKDAPINYLDDLNPDSLKVVYPVYLESSASSLKEGDKVQFEREGYYVVDKDSTPERLVFNKTVAMKEDKNKAS